MITFNCGVPCSHPILIEGYGLGQFVKHYEDGDILVYMGSRRLFRSPGLTRWRYACQQA